METQHHHTGTLAGTISGTLLAFVGNIHSDDLVKTAVLAAIGAVVSFVVSIGLRWISKRVKRG